MHMHLTCTRKIAARPHRTGEQPHRCQDVIACASLLSIILLHKHKHMGQHKTHIHNTGLANYVGWACLQASMLSGAKAPHDTPTGPKQVSRDTCAANSPYHLGGAQMTLL